MRDKIVTNNKYFDKFIEEKENLIHDTISRIEFGVLTDDQVPFARYQIFLFTLEKLIAKYSAGSSLDEIRKDYSNTLNLLLDGWDDSVVKLKLGTKTSNQYMLNQYCYMVWMLSLGVLLNISQSEKLALSKLISNGNIKDELIIFLVDFITNNRVIVDVYKTTYKPFKTLVKHGDLNNINSNDVKKYLTGWYKNSNLLAWHNYRSSIERTRYYYGYWSFEAAAIVVVLGLDDSSFEENEYYPKDLVDYYNKINSHPS